jgi:stage V sporulation protein AC
MEYKAEGPVLGVGSKIFSLAGPVILLGVALSWIVGVIYWIIGIM